MVTKKTLKYLAAVTAVLFAAGAAIGEDRDVLWIVDDVVFVWVHSLRPRLDRAERRRPGALAQALRPRERADLIGEGSGGLGPARSFSRS